MSQQAHQICMDRLFWFQHVAEADAWIAEAICSFSLLSQCSESSLAPRGCTLMCTSFQHACGRSHPTHADQFYSVMHTSRSASTASVSLSFRRARGASPHVACVAMLRIERSCAHRLHGATNSTRRLSARPASVALDPTGARSPTPAVRSRACATRKFFTSSAATASARRFDRSRL